jgi:hypothetical protein
MIIGKMRSAIPVFWTMMAILSLASMVFGQSNDGSITGTVKDKTGASVPGATVTIANPERAVTQKTSTGEAGTFIFPLVPPGTYTITVENTGFKKYEKSNVVLTTGAKLNTGDKAQRAVGPQL